MNDGIGMRGQFHFKLKASNGTLKDERSVINTITLSGKGAVSGLVLTDITASYAPFDAIAIGLGTTGALSADTALATEYAKVACVGTQAQVTSTRDTAQLVGSFAFTGAAAIVEAGVFNMSASATGVMLARQTFAVLNATSGDTLAVTYKVTFA
jgi:hypothetical protein